MKFIVGRTNLLNVLNTVGKSLGTGVIAASSYRFKMAEGILTISACNLETSMEQTIEIIDNDSVFDVMVPADITRKYLSALPDGPLAISFEPFEDGKEVNYNIIIKDGTDSPGGRYVGFDGRDFPYIKLKAPKSFEMDYADLYEGVFATEAAMPAKEEENKTHAIHMEMGETGTSFTGFNGAYLATHKVAAKLEAGSILIPLALVNLIQATSSKGLATIAYSADAISVTTGSLVIKSRLVDASFFDWRPKNEIWKNYVSFDRMQFLAAVKQAIIFSNRHNSGLVININQSKITIKGEDIDFSHKVERVISCTNYDGDFTFGMNAKFLIDALSKFTDIEIFMHFTSPRAFIIFKAEEGLSGETFSLLGPQRLEAETIITPAP